jgi:hypothetical protein
MNLFDTMQSSRKDGQDQDIFRSGNIRRTGSDYSRLNLLKLDGATQQPAAFIHRSGK